MSNKNINNISKSKSCMKGKKDMIREERDTSHDDILIIETPEKRKNIIRRYGDDRNKDTQDFNLID